MKQHVRPALFAVFIIALMTLAGCATPGRQVAVGVYLSMPSCFQYQDNHHSLVSCPGYTQTCFGNFCGVSLGVVPPTIIRSRERDDSDCGVPGTRFRPDGSCYRP
jgi:hypothetical protein